ncbi:hypothetical protein ISCGN_023353 [Ixodes scapularis]
MGVRGNGRSTASPPAPRIPGIPGLRARHPRVLRSCRRPGHHGVSTCEAARPSRRSPCGVCGRSQLPVFPVSGEFWPVCLRLPGGRPGAVPRCPLPRGAWRHRTFRPQLPERLPRHVFCQPGCRPPRCLLLRSAPVPIGRSGRGPAL